MGVVPWCAGGALTPPDFGRSVNPISTGGGARLCPPNITGTSGFLDLPTAPYLHNRMKLSEIFNIYFRYTVCVLILFTPVKSYVVKWP